MKDITPLPEELRDAFGAIRTMKGPSASQENRLFGRINSAIALPATHWPDAPSSAQPGNAGPAIPDGQIAGSLSSSATPAKLGTLAGKASFSAAKFSAAKLVLVSSSAALIASGAFVFQQSHRQQNHAEVQRYRVESGQKSAEKALSQTVEETQSLGATHSFVFEPEVVVQSATATASEKNPRRVQSTVMKKPSRIERTSRSISAEPSSGRASSASIGANDDALGKVEAEPEPTGHNDDEVLEQEPSAQKDRTGSSKNRAQEKARRDVRRKWRSSLAGEQEILEFSRQAIRAGQFYSADEWLLIHQEKFPRGQLTEERKMLQIRVLVGHREHLQAEVAAEQFFHHYPQSMFRSAIERWLNES